MNITTSLFSLSHYPGHGHGGPKFLVVDMMQVTIGLQPGGGPTCISDQGNRAITKEYDGALKIALKIGSSCST
ncbi:hypothetical protein OROGR_028104 [Orobanche gracilis]